MLRHLASLSLDQAIELVPFSRLRVDAAAAAARGDALWSSLAFARQHLLKRCGVSYHPRASQGRGLPVPPKTSLASLPLRYVLRDSPYIHISFVGGFAQVLWVIGWTLGVPDAQYPTLVAASQLPVSFRHSLLHGVRHCDGTPLAPDLQDLLFSEILLGLDLSSESGQGFLSAHRIADATIPPLAKTYQFEFLHLANAAHQHFHSEQRRHITQTLKVVALRVALTLRDALLCHTLRALTYLGHSPSTTHAIPTPLGYLLPWASFTPHALQSMLNAASASVAAAVGLDLRLLLQTSPIQTLRSAPPTAPLVHPPQPFLPQQPPVPLFATSLLRVTRHGRVVDLYAPGPPPLPPSPPSEPSFVGSAALVRLRSLASISG